MRNRVWGLIVIVMVVILLAPAGSVLAQESPPPSSPPSGWDILNNVILVILKVAIPPLLAWGLAELKRMVDNMRSQDKWKQIYWAVSSAVSAAEQLGLTHQLAEFGENKLQVAIDFVQARLDAQGIHLDADEYATVIRGLIEDAVRTQFPHDAEEQPAA